MADERDDLYVSPWWQASLLPDRWDVAGVACHPLSLWHLWMLENIRNPYACGGSRDRDAAAALLLFCERDMAGGKRLMLRPFERARAMRKMYRRVRKVQWDALDAACVDYFQACTRTPDHAIPDGKTGGGAKAPWQWHMVLFLSGCDPSKLESAWDTPYAVARCLWDAHGETEGGKTLVGAKTQRDIDLWVEREAEARMN